MKIGKRILRLQTTIFLMICAVVAMVLIVVYAMFGIQVSRQTKESLENKAISISRTLSRTSTVIESLSGAGDPEAVQRYAERIRLANGVEFVVVLDMNGIRLTHPDPSKIGKHFLGGDEMKALHGQESVSQAKGSLGNSVRAFSPVFGKGGRQLGAVAVGVSLSSVQTAIGQNEWIIYWGVFIGACLGAGSAFLLARKIKRMLFGMEPGEIANLLEERNAMLQCAKEGILAIDGQSRITLANAEAMRLMRAVGLKEEPVGRPAGEFWPALRMNKVLDTGIPLQDMEVALSGLTLLVNVAPVKVGGRIEGAIATFRDKTEIGLLMERLSGISLYVEALRAQTHDFMNKLHVIIGLAHMRRYDRLEEYLTGTIERIQAETGTVVRQIKDPVMAGFLLGKLSRVREAGVRLVIREDGILPESANPEVSRELVTIIGNLLENAIEAPAGEADKMIRIGFLYKNRMLTITVEDNGTGISEENGRHIFDQGYSTKGKDRGIGLYLVGRSLSKLGGSIDWGSQLEEGTLFTVKLPYLAKSDDQHD